MTPIVSTATRPHTYLAVLIALSVTHLLNDLIQSLIPAIYPIIKETYSLDFVQIGMITFTFQMAGSLFQPVVGHVADKHPMPYSTVVGMSFTLAGLIALGFASNYGLIIASAACIGIGSSIFHPEATRMVRQAAGGKDGLGQGLFQIGGQAGGALGPLLAAIIIVPRGQASLSWFAAFALLAMMLMVWTAGQQKIIRKKIAEAAGIVGTRQGYPAATVAIGLVVLMMLMFVKSMYHESFRSFYTFYLIERFGVSIQVSQLMLFLYLVSAAIGAFAGGVAGDRIGRYRIIWISVLGPLPLTLILPYADFFWTGILTILINLIMASAFASILIYALELAPRRIGLIGGLFYGLNFGLAGIAAALLGGLADKIGIEPVYQICSLLPLGGLLAWFLPRLEERRS